MGRFETLFGLETGLSLRTIFSLSLSWSWSWSCTYLLGFGISRPTQFKVHVSGDLQKTSLFA